MANRSSHPPSQALTTGDSPEPASGGIARFVGVILGGIARLIWRGPVWVAALFGFGAAGKGSRFSAAIIALSAKMAKADGVATEGEFEAFRDVFAIESGQLRRVRALYDLAKRDTAGFDSYAMRLKRDFGEEPEVLGDVLDGLFHIAKADGAVHQDELEHLSIIADIFGLDDRDFEALKARHMRGGSGDPYAVLGVARDADADAIKAQYYALVRAHHPDRLRAEGVPRERVRLANERMAAINAAYATLTRKP